jgi:hypothetical protein
LFKSLFRYATQRFKQTEKKQVKSGDLTLRKIDDCLFAIYKNSGGVQNTVSVRYVPLTVHWVYLLLAIVNLFLILIIF